MDRLSVLLMRFGFSTETFFHGEFCGSNRFGERPHIGQLHIVQQGPVLFHHDDGVQLRIDAPTLVLYPRPYAHRLDASAATARLLCADIHLRGAPAPAASALPPFIQLPLAQLPQLRATVELLLAESREGGMGQKLVLDRLCDVLLIQLLRHAAEHEQVSAGRLFGLSSAALSKALTAMHDKPGHNWTVEALAALCGMSRSKFARQFRAEVGDTPAEYLGRQRMLRAQVLLQRGMPVQDIALEVGYSSQPAFTRAFSGKLRMSPRAWLAQNRPA